MEHLLRYSAAAVLMFVGFWATAASIIAGTGVHMEGNAALGIGIAALAFAICLGAYRLVRDLRGEGIYRNAFNVVLLFGSLSLITSVVRFGVDRFSGLDAAERASQEPTNHAFLFMFGGLCLFTLWLLNARVRPRHWCVTVVKSPSHKLRRELQGQIREFRDRKLLKSSASAGHLFPSGALNQRQTQFPGFRNCISHTLQRSAGGLIAC